MAPDIPSRSHNHNPPAPARYFSWATIQHCKIPLCQSSNHPHPPQPGLLLPMLPSFNTCSCQRTFWNHRTQCPEPQNVRPIQRKEWKQDLCDPMASETRASMTWLFTQRWYTIRTIPLAQGWGRERKSRDHRRFRCSSEWEHPCYLISESAK